MSFKFHVGELLLLLIFGLSFNDWYICFCHKVKNQKMQQSHLVLKTPIKKNMPVLLRENLSSFHLFSLSFFWIFCECALNYCFFVDLEYCFCLSEVRENDKQQNIFFENCSFAHSSYSPPKNSTYFYEALWWVYSWQIQKCFSTIVLLG